MHRPDDPYALEREKWRSFPRKRPGVIEVPGPGQESVWNYPRPPRVEPVSHRIRVEFGGIVLADSARALRICETASPPVYYLPPADVATTRLEPSTRTSFCEWKGVASYWSVRVGDRLARDAGWSYAAPDPGFEAIRDYLAFYPRRMDACWVGQHRVSPQPGFYYGGWLTPDLTGPFKGIPGSEAW